MKKELSGLEIGFMAAEFNQLKNSRLDKITALGKEFCLDFYASGIGKKTVCLKLPSFCYISSQKPVGRQQNFLLVLRKHLASSRLLRVEQLKSERVIRFLLSTKEGEQELIAELFSKGNLVLCKEGKIVGVMENQDWGKRTLRKGFEYKLPEPVHDFRISETGLKELIASSNKDSLVKALAIDLGLGGLYAEELCLVSGIEKTQKPAVFKDAKKLYSGLQKLLSMKPEPRIVLDGKKAVDAVPFGLLFYKNFESKKTASFSQAIEEFLELTKDIVEDPRVARQERIIFEQEAKIQELEAELADSKRKAELVYESYAAVKDILDTLKKAREKYSWDEIKSRLKNHQTIKSIDEKTGRIEVEL